MSKEISASDAYEALSTIVLAIRHDKHLSKWFQGLSRLSTVDRRNEVYRMRDELQSGGDKAGEDIAAALLLLADDRVFSAAQEAMEAL